MTTDPTQEDPFLGASIDALRHALRHAHGAPAADDDVDEALARMSGAPDILGLMSGWAAAVWAVDPRYAPTAGTGSVVLLAIDRTTGRQANPDGNVPPAALLGARLAVALLNDDTDTALALWETAAATTTQEAVVRSVLLRMAAVAAPRVPAHELDPGNSHG